jgi:hypothetical protein
MDRQTGSRTWLQTTEAFRTAYRIHRATLRLALPFYARPAGFPTTTGLSAAMNGPSPVGELTRGRLERLAALIGYDGRILESVPEATLEAYADGIAGTAPGQRSRGTGRTAPPRAPRAK